VSAQTTGEHTGSPLQRVYRIFTGHIGSWFFNRTVPKNGNVYDIFNIERSALTFYHVVSFSHRTLDKTSFTEYRKA